MSDQMCTLYAGTVTLDRKMTSLHQSENIIAL